MRIYHRKIISEIYKYISDTEIIAIHGSRQVGKTCLLHYLIENKLKEEVSDNNIFYFDLEDFALLDLCNDGPDKVMRYMQAKGADSEKRIYLLIDEVQYLENPSSFLKLFHDRYKDKVKLIVSGSSSFLIKKKFKDSLVGRTVNFELFTLDFEEFLTFKEETFDLYKPLDTVEKELEPLFKEYVLYGGYPAIVQEMAIEKKEKKLKQIINTYIKKDIRDITNIRDTAKFNNLLQIIASQSGGLVNINELSNTVGIAKQTVYEYLFIMEATYIIKKTTPFHKNIRNELTKMPKIFLEDTGLLNILLNKSFSGKISGKLLENAVFTILRKNIDIDNINFWRTADGKEVDFIINYPVDKKITPIEVKSGFLRKNLTSLKYFKKKYNTKKEFFCCLKKSQESDIAEIIYPWDLYNKILKS